MAFPIGLAALGIGAGANLASSLFARKPKVRQQSTVTPRQAALNQWAGQQAQNIYANPTQGFEPIAQHAANQFNNTIVPNLAQRFTTQTNGRLSSPSFGKELGMAGEDWQQALNAQAAQYGLAQQGQANQLLNQSQSPEFENVYSSGGQSPLSSAFNGVGQAANQYGQFQQFQDLFGKLNQPQPQQPQQGAAQTAASLMAPPISQFAGQGGTAGLINGGYAQQPPQNMNNAQGLSYLNQQIPGSYGMSPGNFQIPYGGQALGSRARMNAIGNQARQALGY